MDRERSEIGELAKVQDYVNQKLCEYERLEVGVFPITHSIIRRKSKPCAVYFCLHGPRSVKFTAIWERETNTVFLYGASGERFGKLTMETSALA